MIFNIDLDTKVIDEPGWEEIWIKTRKAILKELGLKFVGYTKKPSIKCKDCNKSWVVFESEMKLFKKCKFCGSKNLTTSRGYHIQIEANGRKITEKEKNMIEWLLGCDEMKVWLTQQKLKMGIKNANLFFSEVRWRKPQSKECRTCPYILILKKIGEISELIDSLKNWKPKKERCLGENGYPECGAKANVEEILLS